MQISPSLKSKTYENSGKNKQEGHDGPVSLHWLIHKIPLYQTLQNLGISLKQKTPKTGLQLVAIVLMFSNKKIFIVFTIKL